MRSEPFVIRPEDKAGRVLAMCVAAIRQMLSAGLWVSVSINKWVPGKTSAQHRTVWMWDTEVAAHLTVAGALVGNSTVWKKEDVHEFVFKRLCMPSEELVLPDEEIVFRPIGLSDKRVTREMVSEAMEKYQAWAVEHGIELTQPEEEIVWR